MSQPPIPLDYRHEVPRTKVSGHLIAAVLIGLLTWAPIFSALATYLLARVGRRYVASGARRGPALLNVARVLAIVNLLVAPVLTILVVGFVTAARDRAMMVRSMTNLRQISMGIMIYSTSNRGFLPPDLDSAATAARLSPSVFRSPKADPTKPATTLSLGPCDYVYVPPADKLTRVRNGAVTPMVYEPPAHYGNLKTIVAFVDGHVEVVFPPRMGALIAQVDANRAAASRLKGVPGATPMAP